MQRLVVALAFCCSLTASVQAESRKFPYEAVVRAENVTVRCGQGKNYYATSRLEKGAVLTVHRHDPGGWYMVSPPEGSFSWIAAESVQVDAPGTGTVTLPVGNVDGAPVWVGSELSPDHAVRQRVLQSGDTVQILSEDLFQTSTGSTRVYKIVPPPREFRWVKGDFVVPRNESQRREALNDPYSNPLAVAEEAEAAWEETASSPLQLIDREVSTPATAESNDARAALREIDRHYTDMIELDPTEWDLEELARSYEGLATSSPQLASQIQRRLAALESRRKLHAEYRSFTRLSAETTQRDLQLATQGQPTPVELVLEVNLGDPSLLPTPVQVATAGPAPIAITPSYPVQSTPSQPASVTPQLNGAGIVQRLPNGRYGLVSPEGKLLAVLQVDRASSLDRVVGQSMGFIGERTFNPQLGTDLLVVQRMLPIQLAR